MGHFRYSKVYCICVEDCDESLCSSHCDYQTIESVNDSDIEHYYRARCRLYDKELKYPSRDEHCKRCDECLTIFDRIDGLKTI